jgi:hypothetical protein
MRTRFLLFAGLVILAFAVSSARAEFDSGGAPSKPAQAEAN